MRNKLFLLVCGDTYLVAIGAGVVPAVLGPIVGPVWDQ